MSRISTFSTDLIPSPIWTRLELKSGLHDTPQVLEGWVLPVPNNPTQLMLQPAATYTPYGMFVVIQLSDVILMEGALHPNEFKVSYASK